MKTQDAGQIAVRFEGVSRHFANVRAVDQVDLTIKAGEFFAMLGPSGSGKTTCLRLIAGFEQPTSGHIEIFGETAEGVPPYRRNVNTVFQDYALFPHMSVADNVAYGLRVRGIGRDERLSKAEEALALVALPGYGSRKPGQLSGGQRQRVALARALVNEPRVLLLDEPLGALDLKLREQMQVELKTLQRRLGITFVFVTHDQGEALSMADRVAIFDHGRIVQIGTPREIYETPATKFVADFVGSSNILSPAFMAMIKGPNRWASVRPEQITLSKPSGKSGALLGKITSTHYQGSVTRVNLLVNDTHRLSAVVPAAEYRIGDSLRLSWESDAIHLLEDKP